MSEIKDSGERRQFESGAVRDVQENKGRCDLMPLDVVATFLRGNVILEDIDQYVYKGDIDCLYTALRNFCAEEGVGYPTAMLEVSKHYKKGALKYVERNWEKGIPLHSYIDSGVRHYLKHIRGDRDEPHDLAFMWNMLCAIWTHKHKPEFIDLPFKDSLKTTTLEDSGNNYSERIAERAKKHQETSFA